MRRAAATLAALFAVPVAAFLAFPGAAQANELRVGDGKTTTQSRDVPGFDAIELRSAADVTVHVGGQHAVSVTVDGNLQPELQTEVLGDTLVISSRDGIRPRVKVRVDVTLPSLRKFALSGSGDVTVDGGKGPVDLAIEGSGNLRWKGEASELRASIEGSGDLRLQGRADRLKVSVDGSGDVDAAGLRAKDVAAAVSGSGDVDVRVDGGTLTATVAGSGDIRYRGETKVESVTVSGSGSVAREE